MHQIIFITIFINNKCNFFNKDYNNLYYLTYKANSNLSNTSNFKMVKVIFYYNLLKQIINFYILFYFKKNYFIKNIMALEDCNYGTHFK